MIPEIQEIGFGPGTAKSYATLHQATVSLQEMGERTISTQVRIDGDVVPDFTGWELMFKGERFVLPTAVPQASKDNTTRNALVDLNFTSWIILELKRYYFMSLSQIDAGTAIADKYKASVILPLRQFVELFNRVLKYYFGDTVRMDLFQPDIYSTTPIAVDIDYTHIWDVLLKFYELFNVRWTIAVENGVYVIKVGYAADSIDDHDFEYGYEGGLLRFERQVQDEDITNILLGRGGEKNLPYRYFKQQDPQNPEWAEDPDAIPELANIYFDRLRDAAFRWYVRGWMQNPNRDTSWDATHTFPTYSDVPEEYQYAYNRGRTDAKFNPVEFAKDDDSIAKYGERWGALDDNDEIYPTVQGVIRNPMGRVDEVIAVSDIITDDIEAASKEASTVREINGTTTITNNFAAQEQKTDIFKTEEFTIPSGSTGNLHWTWLNPRTQGGAGVPAIVLNTGAGAITAVNVNTGVEYAPDGLPSGTYYAKITLNARNYNTSGGYNYVTYGLNSLSLNVSVINTETWKPTFDIWVKNIWETTQGQEESDAQYAARVWEKILGDRVGNEAKIVFSDGFMSISEDYEFQIASYPVVDRSRTFIDSDGHTYQSEWKITLRKSDAEFEATGLFIPNASASGKPQAGDHFYFIGIDMPFQYVEWAEEQVHASKLESLQGTSDINPTWVINLDKVRVHTIEEADYGTALADRLAAGATVWIKDRRFTPGERLQLFVQSITYTWNEPSDGSPYLVPDIEVVLSDKVNASEGVVQKLQGSVDVIRSTYAKTSDLEAVVRRVASPLFLKKTGENDSSESPTTFSSKLSSKNFRQGDIGGAGWGFYRDGDDESVLELDKVVVRHEMRVNNLVSNQISYVGGKQITSAASIECTQVVDATEGYYCYFDQKHGTVANLFVVGDFAMVQDFNPENVELRYYRARVDEVGLNYILLSKTVTDGDGDPKEGDTIIQYGNESVAARQYVIIRDVIGGGYERMLSDLNSVNAAGKEYYFAGRVSGQSPRWFVGDSIGEYAEWVNGRLNIKGTLIIRNADGSYQAMTDYMESVQRQIDGQIQSWSSGQAQAPQTEPYPQVVDDVVDPTTANFPASSWALDTDREQHFGDIYVDDSTGQGYRYTKRVKNGVTEYYWTRITDEEVAEAMRLAQLANTRVDGLEYLKEATNNGATLVDGGLILSNLMALGQTINQQFQINAGINGIMNAGRTRLGGGVAAWFGGNISDKDDLDQGVTAYAKSLFRFDGSGYLAGGNIHWDSAGYGGIPGITWSGNDIIIGGNVKLASLTGDSVTELVTLVRALSNMFIDEEYTEGGQTRHRIKVNPSFTGFYAEGFISAGGVGSSGGGGGEGASLLEVWRSLTNNPQLVDSDITSTLKIAAAHIPIGAGLTVNSQGLIDVTVTGTVTSVAGVSPVGGNVPASELADALGLDTVSRCLQSLQSQIDSVASKDDFDELNATVLHADMLSVSGIYAEAITLKGADLSTTLTGLSTAIGNEATARANADSALSTAIGNEATARANADSALESGISTLNSYFTNEAANNALKLGGQLPSYYATASALSGVSDRLGVLEARQNWDDIFGIDENGNVYIKQYQVDGETRSRGFWGYSFVTAGGVGSSSGGGDVDLDRVWESLTNNTDKPNVKINTAHIPSLPWSIITSGKPTTLSGYGITNAYTKTEVDNLIGAIDQFHYEIYPSISDITTPTGNVLYLIGPTGSGSDKYEEYVYANGAFTKIGDTTIDLSAYLTIASAQATYQPIISNLSTIETQAGHGETAYNSLDTISDCLQSLQSQIDSVASRNGFGELTATVLFADMISAPSIYVETLSLNGDDLAGALSNLSSRATSLEGRATSLESRATSLESRATSLEGKFTGDSANSALRLAGTSAYNIWGVEYWANGVPKSVTGRPGLFIGSTQVQTSNSPQALAGITTLTASGLATIAGGISLGGTFEGVDSKIVWDATNSAWHLIGNFYADGFIVAGGTGSSGGGGDVDLDRVWESLTNNTDFPNIKILGAHIPDMAATYGYLKSITSAMVVSALGYTPFSSANFTKANIQSTLGISAWALDTSKPSYSVSEITGLQSALDEKQPVISDLATIRTNAAHGETAYNSLSTVSVVLQSLQSQIDSVASRDCFDELAASVFHSDMMAVSDLYAGTISLNGADLATSLSGLSTAIANEATARANAIAAEVTARNTAIANAVNALDSATEAVSSGYFLTGVTITDGKITGRAQANSISGNAATATRLSDNNAHYLWGVSYWASGVPQDVTAAPNLYIAGTKVRASAASDTLLGVTAISNASSSGSTGDETRIEWDATNHAWHFYGGIYADTFVVAGGVGLAGGGSDIDLDRVWESLTNNTDFPDVEINPEHIPGIAWGKITSGKPTTLAGYGITDARFGTAGADYVPITLGTATKNVLTAHQSLSAYATKDYVGQQGFITKAVNDLVNYYTKAQTYTRDEVNDIIGSINQFHYEVAASTSAVTDPQSNVLYLIGPTGSGSDKYEEYVYTSQWIKIGDTSIDLTPYLTKTLAAQTYQPIISDLATIRSNAEKGSTAYSDLTTVSTILQSLQSQVDSVASRDAFDELTATVFYSDVAAVSDLYVGAVSLNGVDLAGSLSSLESRATSLESRATSLESRATSLEGKFTGDSANSALRLTTVSKTAWGQTYWTSGGVPDSISGNMSSVGSISMNGSISGVTSITASGLIKTTNYVQASRFYLTDSIYFVADSNGVKLEGAGFYTDSFVTAGGIGSGGGGGDMDIDRMWQSLTNNPADQGYENTKIAQAHIPDMATTYGYLKGNQTITLTGVVTGSGTTSIATSIADGALTIAMVSGLQAALDSKTGNTGTVTSVGLSVPTGLSVSGSPITTSGTLAITFASGYSIPTTAQQSAWSGKQDAISDLATIRSNAANGATAYSWGNHASAGYLTSANGTTISQALQSLQSQVDSVAARNMFDELSATVLNADTLTATSAYIGTVNGSLNGNATTASYLVSASYGIGGGLNPIYFSGGRPVASTSTAGSASVPVYLNGGTLTAITPSSLFSALSSSAATNLSVTIAGQGRTIVDLYARYDKDGGEIAPNMNTIGTALRSLQSQVDSVASRNAFDELTATVLFSDMLSVGGDATVGGTLRVFEAATLGSSLSVAGAASFMGTLWVSSTANLNGALNVSNTAKIANTLTLGSGAAYPSFFLNANAQSGLKIWGEDAATSYMLYKGGKLGINMTPTNTVDITGTLGATGLATFAGGVKLTTTKKIWFDDTHYIELDSNGYLHTNAGFYSDSFITAGAANTNA